MEFSSVHQACIYLIQNTDKAVILWNILLFKILKYFLFEYILKCDLYMWCKAVSSASLLQCHMIFRNNYMLICCSRNITIIILNNI